MNIKKWIYSAVALFAFLLGPMNTFAHNGVEHILGTVAAMAENSITVETVKHTKVTVLIEPATKFTNSNVQATFKDLKVGERVVVNAKENADKKLVSAEVKWGAGSMKMDKGADSTKMDRMEGMDHKH